MEQTPVSPPVRLNYLRRAIGAAGCLSPVALLIASLIYGLLTDGDGTSGILIAIGGLLFGIVNAHLSVGRPLLYRLRHGGMEGFKFVSGLPLFGTVAATLAGIVGFGAAYTALIGLAALAIDTGGLPWFLVFTWRDRGFWDD